MISVGSGRMTVVGADTGIPQQVYRIVGPDPNTPSRSAVIFQSGAAGPLPLQQFQTSKSGSESILLSPDAAPRVVSYRIHPVRSEMDFSRPAAVYSSECRAPVNQYQGVSGTCPSSNASGWRTTGDNDHASCGSLSRGNSSDADVYGTFPSANDRRTVRIQIGETPENTGRGSNEGTNSFHQVYQTQLPTRHATPYYYNGQQPSLDQSATPSSTAYSDGGVTPSFTVRTVGPVTDFGELVCESIRQFLAHKQRQQQQQQQQQLLQQVQSAVPWRRPRDFVGQSSVVAVPQSGTATPPTTTVFHQTVPDPDQTAETSDLASPVADDRNMFQRYDFQFGSIGNFGRGVSDVATPTAAAGSRRGEQVRYTGSSSTAPIAVFRFQDFDDMVARMRDQSAPQTSVNVAHPAASQTGINLRHRRQQQQQQPPQEQQQLQRESHGARLHIDVDQETDDDSGYSTSRSVPDYQSRDVMAPVTTPTSDARVPASYEVDSREELRQKISAFNNNSHGFIMSLEQNSDVFHGFIHVVMNLIRPVQMSSQPTSLCDVNTTSRDDDNAASVTTFHLPKDTTKVIHITSETTTREVIRTLLAKFHIQDNPRKFALYEQLQDQNQGDGYMRRLGDTERPLPLCLRWAEAGADRLNRTRFILQENDTGEIMWEAFSLPELESFLLILHKEEETYLQEIRETYHVLRIQMQQRLKQLRQDRIGPGARLKPVVA